MTTYQPVPDVDNAFTFTVTVHGLGKRAQLEESITRSLLLGLKHSVPGCEVVDQDGAILALGPKNVVERYAVQPKKPAKKKTKVTKKG